MKVENQDLKQIIKLKEELELKDSSASVIEDIVEENAWKIHSVKKKMEVLNCMKCSFKSKDMPLLKKHMVDAHPEKQFNCNQCDFQATSQLQLNKHINLKHKVVGQNLEQVIQCKNCGEQFSEKWNLMTHRKLKHKNTIAFCRNNLLGKCSFTSEMCWWNHEKSQNDQNSSVECFLCGEPFDSKAGMMIHRKSVHKSKVRKCTNFMQNNCKFENKACWYMHDQEEMDIDEDIGKDKETDKEDVSDSVFQKVMENLKPPIRKQKKD